MKKYGTLLLTIQLVSRIQAFVVSKERPSGVRQESHLCASEPWQGEVVPNGKIHGCSIQEGSTSSEWILQIDGVEADLGRFSQAVYQKILKDAQQLRFQGFRPGTIPPHLEPTYRAFAMDECARETVLEAMQQNNIRPFENARAEMEFKDFFIPPASVKTSKKKKKKGSAANLDKEAEQQQTQLDQWRSFDTMKEAIDAGWKPGQSFSFIAMKVKGQKVKDASETAGATPLGLNY